LLLSLGKSQYLFYLREKNGMKTIVLVRHAKTEKVSGKVDFDRKLQEKGLKQLPLMKDFLAAACSAIPVSIICSTSRRTRATLKGIEDAFTNRKSDFIEDLYLAERSEITDLIEQLDADNDVLVVVGHNDGLSDTASYYHGDYLHMSTGDCIIFEFETDKWDGISRANATLRHHFSPQVSN
jgi:phosphohistidine phosphatase